MVERIIWIIYFGRVENKMIEYNRVKETGALKRNIILRGRLNKISNIE